MFLYFENYYNHSSYDIVTPDPVHLSDRRTPEHEDVSGRRESQMFCQQVEIEPSVVRTCSAVPCIILQ